MTKTQEKLDEILNNSYSKKELNSKCGVYILTINNKHYVGSCKLITTKQSRDGFYHRLYIHIRDLLLGKHHSVKLQRAVNKYGIENLQFDVLFDCPSNMTRDIEQYWINTLDSHKNGYNSCPFTYNTAGLPVSEETRKKMSSSQKGRVAWNKGLKTSLGRPKKGKREHYPSRAKDKHYKAKKVFQYDLEGNFVKAWDYIKQTSEQGYKYKQIYSCLCGWQRTACNFQWFYEFKGNTVNEVKFIRLNQFQKINLS